MSKSLIVDCFPFFQELDILEIRLNILNPIVDYFIIVESNHTFSGKPKELLFKKNSHRYKQFYKKILYCDIKFEKDNQINPWIRQYIARNTLYSIYSKNFLSNDVFILSDLDEIPDPLKIEESLNLLDYLTFFVTFQLKDFCYYLNTHYVDDPYMLGPVLGTIDCDKPLETIDSKYVGFQQIREDRDKYPIIKDAGWHYSYCGDVDFISSKFSSLSNIALDTEDQNNLNLLQEKKKQLKTPSAQGKQSLLKRIDLTGGFAHNHILNNIEKYKNLGLVLS